jgi:hypothetical protein
LWFLEKGCAGGGSGYLAGWLDAMDLLLVVFLTFMLSVWFVPILERSGVRAGHGDGVKKRVK